MKSGRRIGMLLALVGLVACETQTKKEAQPVAGWSGPMQVMALDVRNLLPYLYDAHSYRDPKNKDAIRRHLLEFAQAADHIKPEMGRKILGDDPLIDYSLKNLKEDLNRAVYSFQNGQTEYSRMVAKSSLGHCFRCHSVTQPGATTTWNLDHLDSLNLAPLEKADLFVATRKFDKALVHMEGFLAKPDFSRPNGFDFENLLRRYLALVIRVEKDPKRALARMEKVGTTEDTPHYLIDLMARWRQSLKNWANEKRVVIRNSQELFREVEKRFATAEKIQGYDKDRAGDVEYLRATALLHEGMKLVKSPKDQARALYLLGRSYEVLDELGSWNLHETYYEACLHKEPKSPMAKRCYSRLEASLYMGYSGSSGTNLPIEERERLKRLKALIQ